MSHLANTPPVCGTLLRVGSRDLDRDSGLAGYRLALSRAGREGILGGVGCDFV